MPTYATSQSGASSDSGISLKKNGIYGAQARGPIELKQPVPITFPVPTLDVDDLEISPPVPEKVLSKDERKNSRAKHISISQPLIPSSHAHKTVTRDHRHSKTHRERERFHSLSSVPPSTLTKLLKAQEEKMKETQVLLSTALAQLDAASARAAQAEAQLRARETSSVVARTQLTADAARAEEAAAIAKREAEVYKLHLRQKEEEVKREKERLKLEEQRRDEAEKEAARARSVARRWREEGRTIQAREEGRREGFGEGLRRGRVVLAAALAAQGSELMYGGNRGLVGDGTAYIEEYEEDEDDRNTAPSRRDHSHSQTRSRHEGSRSNYAPPSSSSARRRTSAPTPQQHSRNRTREPIRSSTTARREYDRPSNASAPASEPASQTQTPRRARSVQTDFSTFQNDLPHVTPPTITPPSIRTEPARMPEPVVMPEPRLEAQTPRSNSSHTQSQASIHLPESHRDAPYRPSPPVQPVLHSVPEPEQQLPTLTQAPQVQPVDTAPDVLPVNQVPLAPGLAPEMASPRPQYATPPEPFYFPMPAPPPNIVVTEPPPPSSPSPENGVEVSTPSTTTGFSMSGFNYLPSFPAVGRAGSASSSGTGTGAGATAGGSSGIRGGYSRGGLGGFERELSTIHEHSREGSAYNESVRDDDYDGNYNVHGGLSESRTRSVDQWRRSLGDETPVSPNASPEADLLRPPSVSSNSRRHLRPPLHANDSQGTLNSANSDLRRQTSSGSTSTHSFVIQVEAPSRPSSPQGTHSHSQDDVGGYLSPNHAPLNPISHDDEPPVIPRFIDETDDGRDSGRFRSIAGRMSTPGVTGPIYTVNTLPPGFVPTPRGGGTRVAQLDESDDEEEEFQIYQPPPGVVTGGTPYPPATSGGPYVNPNRQYSRRGMTSESESSSESEDSKGYSRSRTPAPLSSQHTGLTSTFPAHPMGYANGSGSSSGTTSGRGTPGTGGLLGGIYTVNSNNPLPQPPNFHVGRGQTKSRRKSLRNEVGGSTVTASAIPMPAPTVPQYPKSQPVATGSTVTAAAIPMPAPTVPQYPSNENAYASMPSPTVPQYGPPIQGGSGGRSTMTAPAVPMPSPTVPQYPSQGAAGNSVITPGAVPTPSPTIPQYPSQSAAGSSKMTPAAVPMPTPTVPQYTTNGGAAMPTPSIPQYTPGGGTSMPTPTVPQYTPGGGTSMPMPTVPQYTGGGTSMPTPTVPHYTPSGGTSMPAPTVPQYASPSAAGTSTITVATMPMPAPSSSMTAPTMSMPAPSSSVTAPAAPMPTPTVPNDQGQGSRVTAASVSMPSPIVPQYNQSSGAPTMTPGAMTVPMPSVPQYGSQGSSTPGGGGSRVTSATVLMPSPSVPQYQTGRASKSKSNKSRVTPAAVDMPAPSVPNYQSNQPLTSRVTAPTIPMPTPSSNVIVPAMSMPAPSVPSYPQGSSASGTQSKMVPATMSMPAPSSNVTAPAVPMPMPTVTDYTGAGNRTPGMGNSLLASPSMSNSSRGWGAGSNGAWGPGPSGNGMGTPNMGVGRRASLHAGATPVFSSQPLPVPPPVPSGSTLRRSQTTGHGAYGGGGGGVDSRFSPQYDRGSPTESVDSTTRRNTEANKKSAYARGANSPWGMSSPVLYN